MNKYRDDRTLTLLISTVAVFIIIYVLITILHNLQSYSAEVKAQDRQVVSTEAKVDTEDKSKSNELLATIEEIKEEQFTSAIFFGGEFTPLKLWKDDDTGTWFAYTYHNETEVVYFVTKQAISQELVMTPLLNTDGTPYTLEQYVKIHGEEDDR